MIRILLLTFFIASPLLANAEGFFADAGLGIRWEDGEGGDGFDQQGLLHISAGKEISKFEVAAEFQYFSDDSVNNTITIDRKHYELSVWGRYKVFEKTVSTFYVGAGLGLFWESIETTVFNQTTTNRSDTDFLAGGSGDYSYRLSDRFLLGARIRLLLNTEESFSAVADTLAFLRLEI